MSCPLMPTVLGELALRGMSGRGFGWAGAEQDPGSWPLPIRCCAECRPMALSELALRRIPTYGFERAGAARNPDLWHAALLANWCFFVALRKIPTYGTRFLP